MVKFQDHFLILAFGLKFCIEISNLDGDADSNPKSTFHWFSQNQEVYGRFHFDRMSILGTLTHIATAFCFHMQRTLINLSLQIQFSWNFFLRFNCTYLLLLLNINPSMDTCMQGFVGKKIILQLL